MIRGEMAAWSASEGVRKPKVAGTLRVPSAKNKVVGILGAPIA